MLSEETPVEETQRSGEGAERDTGAAAPTHSRGPTSSHGTILFVGNLPFSTPWQNVKDHFKRAGEVRYTDLIADRHGRPKGSALVTMFTAEGAANAIALFNETEFEGRRLIVRLFDDGPRPAFVERSMAPPYSYHSRRAYPPPGSTPYGGGGYYPAVDPMYPPMMAGRGGRDGYAPSYPHQGMPTDGGEFDRSAPKPRSQQASDAGRRLFVSNLPYDCNAVALRETFQQVGEVERAEIIMTRNGKSRGLGIVIMKSPLEASTAIREFDGIEMASRPMKVRFDNKDRM